MKTEAQYKSMTEKLRLIYSDEEVADYIKWILSYQFKPSSVVLPTNKEVDDASHRFAQTRKENYHDCQESYIKGAFDICDIIQSQLNAAAKQQDGMEVEATLKSGANH